MIKQYKVNRLFVCELSGITRLEDEMQIGEVPHVGIIEFSNRANAINYLRKHERDWFFTACEKWIDHCLIVWRSNGDQSKILLCQTYHDIIHNDFNGKFIHTCADRLVAAKDKLMLALPNENNNSFQSSHQGLTEILQFCERAKGYDY